MKKNRTIFLSILTLIIALFYLFRNTTLSQENPYIGIANNIYCVENQLNEVNPGWERQSITKVTSYTYQDPKGNEIVYYHCNTTYSGNSSEERTDLNTTAIGHVLDLTTTTNYKACTVNSWNAFQCDIGSKRYLCWTISPKDSCILEYIPETISEKDIFRIAMSVKHQGE